MSPILFLAVLSLAVFVGTFGYVVVSAARGGGCRGRNRPSEAKVEAIGFVLQCSGFATLGLGAVSLMRGLVSGAIRPAEIAARLPHYRDVVLHALAASLVAVAALVLLVGLGVLLIRHGRAWVRSGASVWWRYQRRWNRVVTAHGLTSTEHKRVLIPQLRAVAAGAGLDVLTVAMVPGQSPAEWDQASAKLAAAFGAASGRLRATGPNGDIDLEFARPGRGGPKVRVDAVPAPVPALLAAGKPELVATVRAWSLQFSWAFVRVRGNDEKTSRPWFWGRMRWQAMTGYYVAEGV
ncbi:hypothetical protein [Nocardia brasiliensis]|uniref:hypothetical protein n=1 Tax=Nocardia brasiliensis TaxID=37326 RepID=UPI002454484C|nr:hypothetical protein [Nocardia brasiliensis]